MNTEQQQSHLTSDCVGDDLLSAAPVGSVHGPWTVRSVPVDDEPIGKFVQHYIEPHIAEVFYVTEDGADIARLIAAAPDLLEAMRDMLAGWVYIRQFHGDLYGVGWDRAQGKAEAAIAKATGVRA